MHRYLKVSILTVLAVFLLGAGADTLYVQSSKAKILAKPSFKAGVVVTAKKGTELEVIQKKGRWYEVKYGGKTGWVSRLLVSQTPPMGKVSVFAKKGGEDISKSARRRASVMTTAAAARGLAEDDRRRVGAATMSDYAALEKVESLSITESEVDTFVDQAK